MADLAGTGTATGAGAVVFGALTSGSSFLGGAGSFLGSEGVFFGLVGGLATGGSGVTSAAGFASCSSFSFLSSLIAFFSCCSGIYEGVGVS